LGERRTCTAEAVGSNPIISIREYASLPRSELAVRIGY